VSWRLRIQHRTGYRYDRTVVSSYNEARLTPQTGDRQLTLESTVSTRPVTRPLRYWDYWGSMVTAFDLHEPHDELVVTGNAVVETAPSAPVPDAAPTWDRLRTEEVRDRFVEYLAPSSYTAPTPELAGAGRELAAAVAPAGLSALVGGWVRERLRYQPGSTGVHTSAVEAAAAGEGVCQDFAHVALVLLRAAGLPARYVSGYLHPARTAAVGETVVGQSHAWVEVWLGDWWGFDPTNDSPVGERHVVVARGRDYRDVPPLHGVYAGGGGSELTVEVAVTRLR
jgi:transglutaminase-like putative cysteine protease